MKERMIQICEYYGISQREFGVRAGLSASYIRNFTGNTSDASLRKILSTFKEIRRDWLLNGEGEMIAAVEDETAQFKELYFELKNENKKLKEELTNERNRNNQLAQEVIKLSHRILQLNENK